MRRSYFLFIFSTNISIGLAQVPFDTAYQLYLTQIAASEALLQLNKISEAKSYLDACDERYRDVEWHFLNAHLDQSERTLTVGKETYHTAIALSPDGQLIATSGTDSTITLYTFPALKELRKLRGHQSSVSTIAFSNGGSQLASGGRDHTVFIWDVHTGKQLVRNADSFKQGIYQVRFSPDDAKLGVVSWERAEGVQGFAKVLDSRDGQEIMRVDTDNHPAAGIVFTPDGIRIIVSTWGEIVYAFDSGSGETKWKYDLSDYDEYNAFHSIALSPDGTTLAVGSTDHRIHLLHAGDGRLIRRIEPWEGHSKTIKALNFSPDGKLLASAGDDQNIIIWNVHDNAKQATLIGHTQTVTGVVFSHDAHALLSTSADETLRQWNLVQPFMTNYSICDFGPWQSPISGDKKLFSAPCSDNNLAIYDIATGKEKVNFGAQSGLCADFSDDGNIMVTASFDGIVRAWDVQSGTELKTFSGHTGRVDGVEYMNSTAYIISVGDTTMRVWSLLTGTSFRVILLKHSAFRVLMHPDETTVYVGSYEGNITAFNTTTWAPTELFQCSQGLQEMTISADGKSLAIFSGKDIEIWNIQSNTRTHLLSGHEQSGYGLGFSPDGRYLISSSYDQTFKLWNLGNGKCTLTYHGYEDVIYASKFVTDHEFLIGTSQGQMWYYNFR